MGYRINNAYRSEHHNKVFALRKIEGGVLYFTDVNTNEPFNITESDADLFEFEPHELDFPAVFSLWKHKNGNVYIVRSYSNTRNERNDEYPQWVEYANFHTGEFFGRKLIDWYRSMTPLYITANPKYDEPNPGKYGFEEDEGD